jgi:signal transduction histidine kinase
VKYTQNDKNITISFYQDDKIYFVIEDEGIGIPKEELSKVTERFYRVYSSQNKTIKGFGLGLSLVKNSVELLGAEMSLESILGKGTIVQIVFSEKNTKILP